MHETVPSMPLAENATGLQWLGGSEAGAVQASKSAISQARTRLGSQVMRQLAERGFELAFDKEMTGKRFNTQVMTLLGDNLSMNPIPQLVKPILDVYANKDSFSGRPIETMGMERSPMLPKRQALAGAMDMDLEW